MALAGEAIELDLLKKSYDPCREDEASILRRLNRVNGTSLLPPPSQPPTAAGTSAPARTT